MARRCYENSSPAPFYGDTLKVTSNWHGPPMRPGPSAHQGISGLSGQAKFSVRAAKTRLGPIFLPGPGRAEKSTGRAETPPRRAGPPGLDFRATLAQIHKNHFRILCITPRVHGNDGLFFDFLTSPIYQPTQCFSPTRCFSVGTLIDS